MAEFNIQDELLAMQLPEMLAKIGQAVNQANMEAGEFWIPEAEAEIKIALHASKTTEGGVQAQAELFGVGLNASYQSKYAYSAEGSSTIKLKFRAGPKPSSTDKKTTK